MEDKSEKLPDKFDKSDKGDGKGDKDKPLRGIKVRTWKAEDVPSIVEVHREAYADYGTHYSERTFELALNAFPEGQCLAEYRGRVVGYATSLITQLDDNVVYTYDELTGHATFSTHDPGGDTLYGADIAVLPEFRGRGVSQLLYAFRDKLLKRHNLLRMVAYGRLYGYKDYAGRMTPEEYVERVVAGEIKDPALNAHLKTGYQVKRVMLDLFRDRSSLNYSTIIEKPNPDFDPAKRKLAAPPLKRAARRARVCCAQYFMRRIGTWEEFEDAVEFYVHSADEYHCHFLLFPELFTVQLLSTLPENMPIKEAIQKLADLEERFCEMFSKFSRDYGVFIIAGSTPVRRDDKLYNTSFLFSPSGNIYRQEKLHITQWEREQGIMPGTGLKVFDTSLGRIAIQICYDIEFPELTRLLGAAGVEVIFVPFSTDERKAYQRVRYCAQARAIENSLYVALAGNVGNLPHRAYLLNYGQAAIVTPSDFGFPPEATAAEADPNVETVVIADLDFADLAMQRDMGSVRPLYDRRIDLYDLRALHEIEIIPVE